MIVLGGHVLGQIRNAANDVAELLRQRLGLLSDAWSAYDRFDAHGSTLGQRHLLVQNDMSVFYAAAVNHHQLLAAAGLGRLDYSIRRPLAPWIWGTSAAAPPRLLEIPPAINYDGPQWGERSVRLTQVYGWHVRHARQEKA